MKHLGSSWRHQSASSLALMHQGDTILYLARSLSSGLWKCGSWHYPRSIYGPVRTAIIEVLSGLKRRLQMVKVMSPDSGIPVVLLHWLHGGAWYIVFSLSGSGWNPSVLYRSPQKLKKDRQMAHFLALKKGHCLSRFPWTSVSMCHGLYLCCHHDHQS